MAYRTNISGRDRGGAIAAVIAIHAGLFFVLMHLSGNLEVPGAEAVMQVFNLSEPPPPPPNPPPPPQTRQEKAKPKETEGGSPANIKSQATPVQAPKPKIVLPPIQEIAASETPRQGTDPTQGAASKAGPGTGAGGSGNGSGSGNGNGTGGGGDGGAVQAPRLVTPVLTGRDIPHVLISQWPRRGTAFLRLRVDERGYVTECSVDRGTGVPSVDSALCNLAHDRLRFRPALNRAGQPVAGWFGYAQPAPR